MNYQLIHQKINRNYTLYTPITSTNCYNELHYLCPGVPGFRPDFACHSFCIKCVGVVHFDMVRTLDSNFVPPKREPTSDWSKITRSFSKRY